MKTHLDPAKARLQDSCELSGILFALCYDENSHRLFGAGTDRSIYEVDLTADQLKAEKKCTHHENYVSCMVCTGGTLITGGFDRRLIWTGLESGAKLRAVEAHKGWVRDLIVLPQRKQIVSVGDDMLIKIWDVDTGQMVRTLDGHARRTPEGYATALYAVAASPDGKTIASGDRIGEVVLWDLETGKPKNRMKARAFYTFDPVKRPRSIGGIRSLSFSPDGNRLAIAGIGRVTNVDGFVGPCRVQLWDWRSVKRVFTGEDSHKAVLNQVHFHPDESWLIGAGGGDSGGILAFWDQQTTKPAHTTKPRDTYSGSASIPRLSVCLLPATGGFRSGDSMPTTTRDGAFRKAGLLDAAISLDGGPVSTGIVHSFGPRLSKVNPTLTKKWPE